MITTARTILMVGGWGAVVGRGQDADATAALNGDGQFKSKLDLAQFLNPSGTNGGEK